MLTQRSHQLELLDLGSEYYTPEEYIHCQKILFRINKILGFFKSTKQLLKLFPKNSSVLDIGCGGGLFILYLSRYFKEMQFLGIDISLDAITLANQNRINQKKFANADNVFFKYRADNNFDYSQFEADILLATLMCHHLRDEALIDFFVQTYASAKKAVIINDLHRHSIPLFFYKYFSPVFRNRLISHDGYISIQRGFIYSEWEKILKQARIKNYKINWCFPFRWQIILWKN